MMDRVRSLEELKERTDQLIGIPLSKIDETNRLATGKGAIGTTIEEFWYGQKPHNDDKPDFKDLNIELKVTPYTRKTKYTAKERLVCCMINYGEEGKVDTFTESTFYKKCSNLLILFYEYLMNTEKSNYVIDYSQFITLDEESKAPFFLTLPPEDIEIIKEDWKKINNKIKEGKAHEISEGDTNFLGACTKSSDSSIRVKQPFSDVPAKPRAYSLKQSYMTYLLNRYIIGKEYGEVLINDYSILKKATMEEHLVGQISQYIGISDIELANRFNINTQNKSFRNRIIASIFNIKGNINNSDLFKKANIVSKTIRIEENGRIVESMSFPAINFNSLISEEWDESSFYNDICLTRFMFTIFSKSGSNYKLKEVKFWNMSTKDQEIAKEVWDNTKLLIKEDKLEIGGKNGFSVLNFPKKKDNPICHIRPHDKDSLSGTYQLSNFQKIINYCFWLNNDYLANILSTK